MLREIRGGKFFLEFTSDIISDTHKLLIAILYQPDAFYFKNIFLIRKLFLETERYSERLEQYLILMEF